MKNWRTTLTINANQNSVITDKINISNGIFQGDSPSGIHFVLCLLPLSWLLKQTNTGYYIGKGKNADRSIEHLLFMDDLKLYAGKTVNWIAY